MSNICFKADSQKKIASPSLSESQTSYLPSLAKVQFKIIKTCIYWVKHYTCGHYADDLKPTLLSHCREYDLILRYWHDQVHYRPLEESNSDIGTLEMPQPCRPKWPIPFPSHKYVPVPQRNNKYPRGLARLTPEDIAILRPSKPAPETSQQRLVRETNLVASTGGFHAVVSHQDQLAKTSILDEEVMYRHFYPGTIVHPPRTGRSAPPRPQPPYPHAYISSILGFNACRNLPNLPPNVIITPHPTGCLRTSSHRCREDPTNPNGLQCPWLLSTRTPWVYPYVDPRSGKGRGVPHSHSRARFLADFSTRAAVSLHRQRDATGSEMTRVGITKDGAIEQIPEFLCERLLSTLPFGPQNRSVPALVNGESTQVVNAPVDHSGVQPRFNGLTQRPGHHQQQCRTPFCGATLRTARGGLSERQANGYHVNERQPNGRQVNSRQVTGRQLNGRQVNGHQVNGRRVNGRQVNGRQANGRQINESQLNGSNANIYQVPHHQNGLNINDIKVPRITVTPATPQTCLSTIKGRTSKTHEQPARPPLLYQSPWQPLPQTRLSLEKGGASEGEKDELEDGAGSLDGKAKSDL